ncbi:unnamed protein product [Protopolystoma xenopodis]|uniref:Uncharacterized protein n=1 Tax=Protopolystoma xenopodis TaxID=117903 RepID=A0A448XCT0_9PLAT|nr:unnamed protein product [Protopolystoma xenopodis]
MQDFELDDQIGTSHNLFYFVQSLQELMATQVLLQMSKMLQDAPLLVCTRPLQQIPRQRWFAWSPGQYDSFAATNLAEARGLVQLSLAGLNRLIFLSPRSNWKSL